MSDSFDSSAPLIGSTLGRYRITALLGQGGMGIVYLAEDETLRREVALKVLSADVSQDDEKRQRLFREAQAAAAVSHPNIAAIYDVGENNGVFYIAMERIRGTSLRSRMDEGRLAVEESVRLAKLILDGLSRAHAAGIVHRDLKPDNVMVDDTGQVKILDFGLAKFVENDKKPVNSSAVLTQVGQFLGTPSYMSPEQAAGLSVDTRSDVFSFGIMLYEMVTGELPFQGTNVLKILAAIERDEPALPSLKNADVPKHIERVVMHCLKKDPAERYAHAQEILQAFEDEKTLDVKIVSPSQTVPPRRTRPLLLGLLVVLVIAVGTGLAGRKSVPIAAPMASVSNSAIAAPVSTPITALPPSKTENTAALAAYREGLQALRDSAWTAAYDAFKHAAELDPTFASAQMRLALSSLSAVTVPDEGRVAFRKAISLRGDLSERDRWMLDALAHVYQRDPPDIEEARTVFQAASEHYPLDAEFLMIANSIYFAMNISPNTRLRAAQKCLELDPQYADCLQLEAWALEHVGRTEDAMRVYDHCIAVSPASSDCLFSKMVANMLGGQCATMEETARRVLTIEPSPQWQTYLGMALLARGERVDVARAIIAKSWENAPEPQRERLKLSDDIQFALLAGHMDVAEKGYLQERKRFEKNDSDVFQSELARDLVRFYQVMHRWKEAAEVADSYLSRRSLFTKGILYDGTLSDKTLFFLKAKADGGLISHEEFVAERARWVSSREARLEDEMKPALWLQAYAELVSTAEDAREAVAAKPKQWKYAEYYGNYATLQNASLGIMYVLADKPKEAIPYLEKVVVNCGIIMFGVTGMVAQYYLGMAREATGNKEGACASYGIVIDRWGQAKPPVPVVAEARAHAQALACLGKK